MYSEECRPVKYLLDNYNGESILEKVEWGMFISISGDGEVGTRRSGLGDRGGGLVGWV